MPKNEAELTWRDLEIGSIVTEPGNARSYETGDWRSRRPTYESARCIKCGLCQVFCPESCVFENAERTFEADMRYCKGCGICARECPTRVIAMVEEG